MSRSVSITVAAVLGGLLLPSCMCTSPQRQPAVQDGKVGAGTRTVQAEAPARARGMWVWGVRPRLADPAGAISLLESCRTAGVNEVYLSVGVELLADPRLHELIVKLGAAGIRVEALNGEASWYQPDKRAPMMAFIDAVGAHNKRHDGGIGAVHLDIEPHQLPENKGNHRFLPELAETLREAQARANQHGLSLSADLPRFAFEEKGALFGEAAARLFVMLYELRDRRAGRLVATSRSVMDSTYASLPASVRGKLVVGVSVDDYPSELDGVLVALDDAHGKAPRYGGWAIHDEAKYRARFTVHDPARSPTRASRR